MCTISDKPTVDGLETWLPASGATMILCENQSGPFVRTEDHNRIVAELEQERKRLVRALKPEQLRDLLGEAGVDLEKADAQLASLKVRLGVANTQLRNAGGGEASQAL